ncbi:MAG: YncE family protein [Bryobacteraceae bacterium]
MRGNFAGGFRAMLFAAAFCAGVRGGDTTAGSFLVTNNDMAPPFVNTATFYAVNPDGTLAAPVTVETYGHGIEGGFFAAPRVAVLPNGADACAYVSDAFSGDIAAMDAATHTVTGTFYGSATDSGGTNGIGLAANSQYLYASFSASATIGTFQVNPGCMLTFVGDITALGLGDGLVAGMAIRGNMMVVAYGDGSIESFDISGGVPVSNGDLQNSTGAGDDHLPNGVTITRDGHYALFGDASTRTAVEVSDISSGALTPTLTYPLGSGWNSGNVTLSPDETVLFVANSSSGKVTAAYFDHTTGKVYPGCTSSTLTGFYTKYSYIGNIGLQLTTGKGGVLYVPEYSGNGKLLIGMLEFTLNQEACTITELPSSPVTDPGTFAYGLSLAVYPEAQ